MTKKKSKSKSKSKGKATTLPKKQKQELKTVLIDLEAGDFENGPFASAVLPRALETEPTEISKSQGLI